MMFGNFFANIVAKVINGTASMQLSEWGNTATTGAPTAANTPNDAVAQGRFAIRNTTGAQPTDSGDTTEHLVLGSFTNALTLGTTVNKGQILVGPTPNPTGLRSLMQFAPWSGSAGGWSVFAGSGPHQVMEWQGAGTQTGCKLGFWGVTPVIQPATTGTSTGFTAGAGTAVNDQSTFTGGTGSTAYRISDVVKAMKQLGLLAA
jgi:hypothetical protein